jgi:hypothetical protein
MRSPRRLADASGARWREDGGTARDKVRHRRATLEERTFFESLLNLRDLPHPRHRGCR